MENALGIILPDEGDGSIADATLPIIEDYGKRGEILCRRHTVENVARKGGKSACILSNKFY